MCRMQKLGLGIEQTIHNVISWQYILMWKSNGRSYQMLSSRGCGRVFNNQWQIRIGRYPAAKSLEPELASGGEIQAASRQL